MITQRTQFVADEMAEMERPGRPHAGHDARARRHGSSRPKMKR